MIDPSPEQIAAKIAKGAVSGTKSEGQIEFEILELLRFPRVSQETPVCPFGAGSPTGWWSCSCGAEHQGAPAEKMQKILRAEEHKPSPEVSSPPQEPMGVLRATAPEEALRAALSAIVAIDLGTDAQGRDDFYTGPDRFFRAHRIAREALNAGDASTPAPEEK